MLVGRDLTVSRGSIMALQGVSLELRPRQVFGVLGPNGAGKSTLLATLSGELRPSRGQVLLQGRALSDWPDVERARCLAVLPQSSTLSFAFRVADVVAMGRLPHRTGRNADATIVAAALAAADAQHLATRSYLELSGGERQRVHLARVLAQLWPGAAGQVLMLDEPTSMLDPAHQHSILKAVRAFAAQGAAALVILHDLNLAARYCDRLLLLRDGQPIMAGPPDKVLRAEPLRAVFGLDVLVQPHPELGHPLIIAR